MEPLSLTRFLPTTTSFTLADLQGSICLHIVDRPVETLCRKLLCADCISDYVRSTDDVAEHKMQCPSCAESHHITSTSFTPASEVVLKILRALLLHCDKPSCSAVVALRHLKEHLESRCQKNTSTFFPSKLTVGQLTSRSLQSPPTSAEQKAAAKVMQRMIYTSQATGCIKPMTEGTVSTGAHIHTYMYILHVHYACTVK